MYVSPGTYKLLVPSMRKKKHEHGSTCHGRLLCSNLTTTLKGFVLESALFSGLCISVYWILV